ncbi:MAG: RNA polymerase sigma factor [Thermodesulfobacteriota bacterium]
MPPAKKAVEAEAVPTDLAAIHDSYHGRVLAYMRSMVGDSEAEDLSQSVFLKAGAALAGFEGRSSVSTWLFRIAANTALDALRQRKNRPSAPVQEESSCAFGIEPFPSAERQAIRDEMAACIRELVDSLPPASRTALYLADVEGFTADEIAQVLGVTPGAAKIRLHRARAALKDLMNAHCRFYRDENNVLSCDRVQPDE